MSPIQTYLDNIFYGLPGTDEMFRARRRMQESMEEKYEALRAQGKSEAEALGTVVSEFGTVSELLRELGQSVEPAPPPRPAFPQGEYDAFRKRFGAAITAGVCLCILGVALGGILHSITGWDMLVIPAFFGPVIAGVALFIYFGIQEDRYDELKRASGWGKYQGADHQTYHTAGANTGKGPVVEAINGIIMLLATVIFLVGGFVYGLWHPGWVVFPVGGILCGMVSIIGGIWQR